MTLEQDQADLGRLFAFGRLTEALDVERQLATAGGDGERWRQPIQAVNPVVDAVLQGAFHQQAEGRPQVAGGMAEPQADGLSRDPGGHRPTCLGEAELVLGGARPQQPGLKNGRELRGAGSAALQAAEHGAENTGLQLLLQPYQCKGRGLGMSG